MIQPKTVDVPVESSSERKIRIFLIIAFFVQTFVTPLPFMRHIDPETGLIDGTISALQFVVQSNGIASDNGYVALYGLVLIVLPITSFFFCLFDKRSKIKYLVTGLTSVICAIIVTFTCGASIHYGAVFTLILNIATLFMTSQGVQATSARVARSR